MKKDQIMNIGIVTHVQSRPTDRSVGLERYGQQPIPYVLDTDLADTIRIRYDTHEHDFRFQNQEFWISRIK